MLVYNNKNYLGLLILIMILALARPVYAGNQNFLINAAQALNISEIEALSDNESRILTFSAFNKDFTVEIWRNPKIHQHIDSGRLSAIGNFYAGTLFEKPESWVRLSEIDNQWSGAIFDGEELFFVDALKKLSSGLDDNVATSLKAVDASTIIVRASDMVQIGTCAFEDTGTTGNVYQDLVTTLDIAEDATRQINIAIVTDTEYNNSVNGNVTSAALAQINVVEGIFESQVNLAFGISEVRVLNNNGSLTSTNASTLLNSFRSYVNSNIGNPGLAHLFTGKNMNGNTIGIAYLNAACKSSGVGVSEAHQGSIGSLIVAHEIGHNTGAPHDNQSGSACAYEPGIYLMNPSINGSDEFSICSQNKINSYLDQVSCLVPPDEPQPPSPPPQPPTGSCIFSTLFINGNDGFVFTPDLETPNLTEGISGNGSLQIRVGGGNNADVINMRGLWERTCTTDIPLNVTLSLNAQLMQTAYYESDEMSDVFISINGQESILASLRGDGNGGSNQDTGLNKYQLINLILPVGTNKISLGCFNSKKTYNNESTVCTFNEVSVVVTGETLYEADFNSGIDGFSFVDDAQDPTFANGQYVADGGTYDSGALEVELGGGK